MFVAGIELLIKNATGACGSLKLRSLKKRSSILLRIRGGEGGINCLVLEVVRGVHQVFRR